MLNDEFLRRLDALDLRMARPAGGGSGGLRRSRALGSGVEFSDFREYAPGDDLRRLDWNAYARFDRLFLKLFMEEQEQRVHLILDASASMGFGEPEKCSCGAQTLEALCYLALRGSDTVTLYVLDGQGERHTRPLNGRHSYPEAAAFLDEARPCGQAPMDELLQRLPLSSGRGVTVLVSDFLWDTGYEKALRSLLYRKQETSVLQLWSREEWEPNLEDAAELRDSETGERLTLTMSYELLKRYRETSRDYAAQLKSFCQRNGVGYGFAIPDQDFQRRMLHDLSRIGLIG